ncbi:hypothetical protein DUNSADRAFT_5242 [Dunaliella salina]|uniref:Uncharacterized protein n=1 Tax=Dunaliella salina TaxID=3046 RepID=A0ABQ7GQM7_DUNSA|nr:hypothetical protein DUNSADRAFT_5242 [Dunaliella salina]|eukprot:KAF5836911.1 hypothetical protein DUNSADRAFT_5242 [Dunaliella salina]
MLSAAEQDTRSNHVGQFPCIYSGLGHLGFGLYKLGCHVTCTERPCELAALQASLEQQKQLKKPPLDAALEHLGASNSAASSAADNSSSDDPEAGSIQALSMEWGEQGYLNSPLSTQNTGAFDVIICSELYYLEQLYPDILWTLKKFSRPGTVVWSVFVDRPFSFYFFALLSDEKCWTVEAIEEFDDLNINPDTQVHMHRITYTPGQESSPS